jgi:TonB family protein
VIPDFVPTDIPLPNHDVVIREMDFSGRGVEGGLGDGAVTGQATTDVRTVGPSFTPYEVQPELRNREEVARALSRNYPRMLRDAGIGGTTILWFRIDIEGNVVETQVFQGSGQAVLDEAAAAVAAIMRFSPAMNRDQPVEVWVQIPINFTVES